MLTLFSLFIVICGVGCRCRCVPSTRTYPSSCSITVNCMQTALTSMIHKAYRVGLLCFICLPFRSLHSYSSDFIFPCCSISSTNTIYSVHSPTLCHRATLANSHYCLLYCLSSLTCTNLYLPSSSFLH